MKYLLDTDTCIYIMKKSNAQLVEKFERNVGQIATSAIVMHQLYFGAAGYVDPHERIFLIEQLVRRLTLVPFDQNSAIAAGQLRHDLKKRGLTIGAVDALIAATAIASDLTLVTENEREFSRVDGLNVDNWIA